MRLAKLAMAIAAGFLLASTATAQQPGRGGRGGFGRGGFNVLNMIQGSEQLQKELKMDKDQVEKLTAALTKAREGFQDDFGKLFDPNTSQEDRTAIQKKMNEANEKAAESVLKSEQMKRLHQIENQRAGFTMFQKEDVQKTLKLTADQKDKIKEIGDDLAKEEREARPANPGGGGRGRGGFDPETQRKIQALQKDALAAATKQLTADQKTALKDLTGEPFELQQGPGGGFPGGGGFGGGFGGFANRGNPGQVLSDGAKTTLKLDDEQKKKLEDLQKEVDSQLKKILTEDQQKQLKELQTQNPFGGGRGGRGGRGNPGGGKPNPDF